MRPICLVAALLFVLGILIPDLGTHNPTTWLLAGLAAWAVDFAIAGYYPTTWARRRPPP